MYVCMYVSNATGMQILQTRFLWAWHFCMCSTKQIKSILHYDGIIYREAAVSREAKYALTQK